MQLQSTEQLNFIWGTLTTRVRYINQRDWFFQLGSWIRRSALLWTKKLWCHLPAIKLRCERYWAGLFSFNKLKLLNGSFASTFTSASFFLDSSTSGRNSWNAASSLSILLSNPKLIKLRARTSSLFCRNRC